MKCAATEDRPFCAAQRTSTCAGGEDARSPINTPMRTAQSRVSAKSSLAGRKKVRGPSAKARRNMAVPIQGSRQTPSGFGTHAARCDPSAAHGASRADHFDAAGSAKRSPRGAERGAETRFGSQSGPRADCRSIPSVVIRGLAERSANASGVPSVGDRDGLRRLTSDR